MDFNKIKNTMLVALLFIGTIIGAGFASGRELVVFFGQDLRYIVLISLTIGVVFFATNYLFLSYGKENKINGISDLTKNLSEKYSFVFDLLIVFCYLIVSASMLAGIDTLSKELFFLDLPILSAASFLLACFFVIKGIKGLKIANAILVPLILGFIIYISFTTISKVPAKIDEAYFGNHPSMTIADGILYASMNMLLASVVMVKASENLSKKEILWGSVIGSVVVSFVVGIFLFAIGKNPAALDAEMPIMLLSNNVTKGLKSLALLVIWFGIFTTLLSSVFPMYEFTEKYMKNKWLTVSLLFVVTFTFSRLGFFEITRIFYPIQSLFGIALIIGILLRFNPPKKKNYAKKPKKPKSKALSQ